MFAISIEFNGLSKKENNMERHNMGHIQNQKKNRYFI